MGWNGGQVTFWGPGVPELIEKQAESLRPVSTVDGTGRGSLVRSGGLTSGWREGSHQRPRGCSLETGCEGEAGRWVRNLLQVSRETMALRGKWLDQDGSERCGQARRWLGCERGGRQSAGLWLQQPARSRDGKNGRRSESGRKKPNHVFCLSCVGLRGVSDA